MGSSLRKQQRSGGRVEVRKVRRKRTLVTSCHGSSLRSSRCSRNAPVGYWQASRFAQPRLTGPTTADTSPGWRPPEAERGLAEHATGRAELRVVATRRSSARRLRTRARTAFVVPAPAGGDQGRQRVCGSATAGAAPSLVVPESCVSPLH